MLIILLITYFTTDQVLLSTFVLSVINKIIPTPQDAIIDRKNLGQISVSNDQSNRRTPYYESIADIHLKLNLNAASVQSNLGCGTLGLLFLTVLPAVYATLYTIAFVPPVNPGPEPIIPTGATGAVIANLRYLHTEATKIFAEYENTAKALRQLLLASTDELYVRSLRHKYIGYGKTTT